MSKVPLSETDLEAADAKSVAGEPSGKSKPLVLQAYELIKEKIIALHFLPGQYINEAAICGSLNIGRTPVHQALQRLEMEGLVEILPRKGVIIQPDTRTEILKILESRQAVEPELVRGAARRGGAGEISAEDAKVLMDLATAPDPAQIPPDINLFTANDRAFHRLLGDLSGNSVMASFARMLHERSTRFWYLNMWQTLDVKRSRDQHTEIAKAVLGGREDDGVRAMTQHISDLHERVSKMQAAY